MRKVSIAKRWYANVFGVILLIITVVEICLGIIISSNLQNSVRQILETRAQVTVQSFSKYVITQHNEFYSGAVSLVHDFDAKDTMELQIVDVDGRVMASTSGFFPADSITSDDFRRAVWGQRASAVTKSSTGESIMVVSAGLRDGSGNIRGVARFMTSLNRVNQVTTVIILIACGVGLLMLILVFVSGIFFMRSIVKPVNDISIIAGKIAKGDYSSRIKSKYNDEISELSSSINEMAEEISKTEQLKNDFISSVSHELRTPLTAIKGWSETMLLYPHSAEDETMERGLSIISDEASRLEKMVEELLDFSRLQSSRIQIAKESVDVGQVLIESIFIMKERATRDEIIIEYLPGDELPNVTGDAGRLKQVFLNIIDNAVKHSKKDQKISISTKFIDGDIFISIKDDGTGISPEDLPRIKEKFYKGSDSMRGSGIGLAIADEIISLHGGDLNISSILGEGVTVMIKLPAEKPVQADE